MAPYPPGHSTLSCPTGAGSTHHRLLFHTVRVGSDPGNHRIRPGFVAVMHVRKYLWYGDWTLSSPGGAGSMSFRLHFSHCAVRYQPREPPCSSPTRWSSICMDSDLGIGLYPAPVASAPRTPGRRFHNARYRIIPGDPCFRARFVGVVHVRKYL